MNMKDQEEIENLKKRILIMDIRIHLIKRIKLEEEKVKNTLIKGKVN